MQVTFKKVSVRDFRGVIFIFEMVPIKQKSNSLGIKKKRQNGCRIATMEIQTASHGTWDLCMARGSQERLPESANLRSIYSVKWQVVNSTHSIGMNSLKAPSPDQSIFRESIWKVWHCWGRVVFKSLDFWRGPVLESRQDPVSNWRASHSIHYEWKALLCALWKLMHCGSIWNTCLVPKEIISVIESSHRYVTDKF